MNRDPQFQVRELFHLSFLRLLAGPLATRAYAVKGGICLRFFHRSQRLSEDMDFDVAGIPVQTLAHHVHTILSGRVLLALLSGWGVSRIEFTSPKQTETTQRWKVQLRLDTGQLLQTRLEFSRRKEKILYSQGTPDPEYLRSYRFPPFMAQYYPVEQMIQQKLEALTAQRRMAARDLFDLHHLLFIVAQNPETSLRNLSSPTLIERAIEKIPFFSFSQFQAEVLPFLTEELASFYREKENFERTKEDLIVVLQKSKRPTP